LAFILVLGSLTACGKDRNLYGTWKGARDWRSLNLDSEEVARALAAVDLELKGTGAFTLNDGSVKFDGNWIQSGDTIELRVESILNRPLEQQSDAVKKSADFVVRYQGGKMFFKNPTDTMEIELKKENETQAKGVS